MPLGALVLTFTVALSLLTGGPVTADPPAVAPTVTAVVPAPLTWGDDWVLTVTVTAAGVVPTGTVHVAWEGTELAVGELVDGTAQLPIDGQALPCGGHGLDVTYDGDGTVAPGRPEDSGGDTPTPFLDHASSRRPELTVTRPPTPHHTGGARVEVGAKRADMPVPTGGVIVRMQGGPTVKRIKRPLVDGVALLPLPRMHRGSWVLRARYLGDEHYRLRHGDDVGVRVR